MRGKFSSTSTRSVLFLIVITTLSACGRPGAGQDSKFVTTAPSSIQDLGLIVQFDSNRQADEFIKKHTGQVRVLHEPTHMYEIYGMSAEDFSSKVGAHQFLEKNRIITGAVPELRPQYFFDANLKRTQFARATQEVEKQGFDASKCKYRSDGDPKLPIPKALMDVVEPISLRDAVRPHVRLGTKIKFDSSRTVHSSGKPRQIDILWAVWGPSGSIYDFKSYYSKQLEFTPDMPGKFDFTMIARDSDDHCSFVAYTLSVNYAEPFEGAKEAREYNTKRDTLLFAQLGSINADEAWKTTEGTGSIIAVLDTGVNYNHPDLAKNIFVNAKGEYGIDVINGTHMPFDDYGHGTHVAGLAASAVTGVARKARILPVKVLDGMGAGDIGSIIKGMLYAADQGATVLNMSLSFESLIPRGVGDPPKADPSDFEQIADAFRSAIKEVGKKGAVVVASAGNSGTNIDANPTYPASLSESSNLTIAVGATSLNGEIADYSNFGSKSVSVAAPGGSSQDADPEKLNDNGGLMSAYYWPVRGKYGYIRFSGTSMASPVTAGVVALVQSAQPDTKNYQIKSVLMKSSDAESSLRGKITSAGKVNAARAIAMRPDAEKKRSGWTKN